MLIAAKSAVLFLMAGMAEIGGGYLVWLWAREHKSFVLAILAIPVLASYGLFQAWQPTHFGRAFAAYGGVFIAMAVLWGWFVDGRRPDTFDLIGAAVAVAGAAIIMAAPRG